MMSTRLDPTMWYNSSGPGDFSAQPYLSLGPGEEVPVLLVPVCKHVSTLPSLKGAFFDANIVQYMSQTVRFVASLFASGGPVIFELAKLKTPTLTVLHAVLRNVLEAEVLSVTIFVVFCLLKSLKPV